MMSRDGVVCKEEEGKRNSTENGVQTCALPISPCFALCACGGAPKGVLSSLLKNEKKRITSHLAADSVVRRVGYLFRSPCLPFLFSNTISLFSLASFTFFL